MVGESRRVYARTLVMLLAVTAVSCMVAATVLSPLMLDLLAPGSLRWEQLSTIGETYGAASAILSAFALIAIGASLFLQAREMRFARAEAQRSHHFQLMQLQIDNPALGSALSLAPTGLDPRLHIYLNLVLSYWEMLHGVGELPERVLVEYARHDFFSTVHGLRFWEHSRAHRHSVADTRSKARFVAAMDRAYEESRMSAGRTGETPATRRPRALATATVVAAGVGWAIWAGWTRVRSRSSSCSAAPRHDGRDLCARHD